jgi:hypothetical protein
VAKRFHARAVNRFNAPLQPCFDHGFGGVAVGGPDTLAEAVVESVIKIEDDATDERSLSGVRRFQCKLSFFVQRWTSLAEATTVAAYRRIHSLREEHQLVPLQL